MDFEQAQSIHQEIDGYEARVDIEENVYHLFYDSFVSPTSLDRFTIFVDSLLAIKESCLKRDKMLQILSDLIYKDGNFVNLLHCTIDNNSEKWEINQDSFLCSKTIAILISLPELLGNLYKKQFPTNFNIKTYITRFCEVIAKVLNQVYREIGKDVTRYNLTPLHNIIGRLCLKSYSDIVWASLLSPIFNLAISDRTWQFILHKTLLPPTDRSLSNDESFFLEPFLKMIFRNASCYQAIVNVIDLNHYTKLLSKVEFLLTNKFLLIYFCSPDLGQTRSEGFLVNLLAFLYHSEHDWFLAAFHNVLDCWANSSAFKHRSYEQHFYLCRVILIASKFFFGIDKHKLCEALVSKYRSVIHSSTTMHLSSSQIEFRVIGLAASSSLLANLTKLNADGVQPPQFDCENFENDDSRYIKQLGCIDINQMLQMESVDNIQEEIPKPESKNKKDQKKEKEKLVSSSNTAELDSDDDEDLQPYDMSNDIKIEDDLRYIGKDLETTQESSENTSENVQRLLLVDNSKYAPVYLQDCIDGLVEYEKPNWMERCLRDSERIIRANYFNPTGSNEEFSRLDTVAKTFAEVLLTLDDRNSIDDFDQLRSNALIALCVGSPKIVANFLTKQFYAPYTTISDRIVVLAILTAASEELSRMKAIESKPDQELQIPSNLLETSKQTRQFQLKYFGSDENQAECEEESESWRDVVDQRIQSKTRIISSRYSKEAMGKNVTSSNRFVPVAGHFFFPLIRDLNKPQPELQVNWKEDDSFLLENLIYALSVLLQNCAHHPQTKQMSKELTEFLYSHRKHDNSNVRLAIIKAFQAIIISTPSYYLLDDLLPQLTEFQYWLKEIIIDDVDRRCMNEAYQTIYALKDILSDSEHVASSVKNRSLINKSDQTLSKETQQIEPDFNPESFLKMLKKS